MEQIQFKDVSRQATNREYLANRIQKSCEMITEYINKRVDDNYKIEATEVFKDFRDKEQLMSLLVVGNYLDKKLDTIREKEDADANNPDNYITLDSAKVLEALNKVQALVGYCKATNTSINKFSKDELKEIIIGE